MTTSRTIKSLTGVVSKGFLASTTRRTKSRSDRTPTNVPRSKTTRCPIFLSAIICSFVGLGAVLLNNRIQSDARAHWFSDRAFELQAQEWADGIEKRLSEGRENTYAVSAGEEMFAKWGVEHNRLAWVTKKPHRLIGLKGTITANAQ